MMPTEYELPYKVMAWLNDHNIYSGRCFSTPYGVLRIWLERGKWEYCYWELEPLPDGLDERGE